jgi:hypothetical protein
MTPMNAVAGRFVTIGRMSGVLKGELDFDLRIRQQRESCAASRSHQKKRPVRTKWVPYLMERCVGP